MNTKGQLLQDPFLNALRKEHVPVSIYLVNGIKLQGQVESFDQYVVLLRNKWKPLLKKSLHWIINSRIISSIHSNNHRLTGGGLGHDGLEVCLNGVS